MSRFIPLSIPNFEGNERKYVDDAIDQGWVSTGGAYITKLEEQMAGFLHVEKVAACQSGTSALHLSLLECNVQPGDMVIVPTLTFIAAVNPVHYQFAEPVFMDCDDSLCMDPVKLRKFCEKECYLQENQLIHTASGKKIKAVIVVHVFGNLADMESIMDIAEEYHLKVIEDATEALGSHYTEGRFAGKYAGTIGDFGAYSFNGNKIITTGGGGAVTAKDAKTVAHMQYISTQAKDDPHYYIHNEVGYNYRMTNLQAALGVSQIDKLEEFISIKERNFNRYAKCLAGIEGLKLLAFTPTIRSNKWFYALYVDEEKFGEKRDALMHRLIDSGVQCRPVWKLTHTQKAYAEMQNYEIEKAYDYEKNVLNIPCSTNLTEEDVEYVCEIIKGR